MRRFSSLFFPLGALLCLAAASAAGGACTTTADDGPSRDIDLDAGPRDGALVEAPDGGSADAGFEAEAPSCEDYCTSVMTSCTGDQAQYASNEECMAFCALLPPGTTGESQGDSIACREFYAGSAARTDNSYCAAAGPFGGAGACGDRCPIFCELTLSACLGSPNGSPPYESYSDCQTACVGYGYVDAGLDGGGETTMGPTSGNTLNCRLYYLRQAVGMGGIGCENLGSDSLACK